MRLPEPLPLPRLAAFLAAAAAVAGLAAVEPSFFPAAILLTLLVLAGAGADFLRGGRPALVHVERQVAEVLSHGAANPVLVTFHNHNAKAARIAMEEVWPPTVSPSRFAFSAVVPAGGTVVWRYAVTPARRGEMQIAAAALRLTAPLGLVARQHQQALPAARVRIYPNISGAGRLALLARRQQALEPAARRLRQIGPGTEIDGLRDYVPDDDFRRIDWKATARKGHAITRELRAETSQNVLLLIDAGRMGAMELEGGRRIDHAINAALLLAHVAASRGDRVGLLVFDRQVRRFAPPRRASRAIVPALARALYDVQASSVEPDYERTFRFLSLRDRRRALIVLFTDVLSPQASGSLLAHLAATRGRHLPLCVAIDDPALRNLAAGNEPDPHRRRAISELRAERDATLTAMRRRGVLVVDAPPASVTPSLISRYLELKARRWL